jgi:antimicrobial peptide system SdpA family protein
MSGDRERGLKRLGAGAIGSSVVLAALLVYGSHEPMAYNAVKLPLEQEAEVNRWFPQGWRFFTRDPREPHALYLERDDATGRWQSAALGPNFLAENLFGFSRRPRAQGIEYGLLMHDVGHLDWTPCKERPEQCLEEARALRTVTNQSPEPTLCGTVGVVMQDQLPWAWAADGADTVMPSRVVKVRVKC